MSSRDRSRSVSVRPRAITCPSLIGITSVVVDPISINNPVFRCTYRAAYVASACQLLAAANCGDAFACSILTNRPSTKYTATFRPPATFSTASSMCPTPSALLQKQSHNSPVMVTASLSDIGAAPTRLSSAAASRCGCRQSANGWEHAHPRAFAALRFAPPISNPSQLIDESSRSLPDRIRSPDLKTPQPASHLARLATLLRPDFPSQPRAAQRTMSSIAD